MRKIFYLLTFTLCVFTLTSAGQNVNHKNGNFYVSYGDIEFDSLTKLALDRSYNSKSVEKGWFGMGWGGPFETYLHSAPGGGVVVRHWGSGTSEVFLSKEPDAQLLSADINLIMTAAQKAKKVETPDEIFQFRQELEENQEKRINEWKKYIDEGLIHDKRPQAGSRLASFMTPNNYVLVTEEGYEFVQGDYRTWFDVRGRQVRYKAPKYPEVSLVYADSRFPLRMKDALGNEIELIFNASGRMEKAIGTDTKGKKDTSVYTYDPETEALTSSLDAGGNFYRFEWDNSYNMVKILYTDGTSTDIEYDEHFFASKVKKKDGSYTIYEYPQVSDLEYGNRYTQYDSAGNPLKSLAYWYVNRVNELGDIWTYKWIIVNNNDSTIYINNEQYGSADTVYQNGGKYFAYGYDNKGNLTGISYSSGQQVKVERDGDNLAKIITPKNTYQAVYKGQRIEKLVTVAGDEIPLPFRPPFTDKKGHRDELVRILPAFMATYYWYDLHIDDVLLDAARKL